VLPQFPRRFPLRIAADATTNRGPAHARDDPDGGMNMKHTTYEKHPRRVALRLVLRSGTGHASPSRDCS
jgi:hypothetical protein